VPQIAWERVTPRNTPARDVERWKHQLRGPGHEQARIEKSLRERLATPKYPAIFSLPQAFEVHSPDTVVAPPTGTARCPSVVRSERGLGGSRAGWGGAVREPVSCALAPGHGGHHKGVSFPISLSKMHTHWEWSDSPKSGSRGSGVPEDAAVMGPTAIASFSGRVVDNTNQGVQGLVPPSLPVADLWRHAGPRFRIGIVGVAVSFVVATERCRGLRSGQLTALQRCGSP